jgi:hypothetical protein
MGRDRREAHLGISINPSFEIHDEFVVQPAMNQQRPVPNRDARKSQLRSNLIIKCLKDDVNDNHIRIQAVNSGRIGEIRTNLPGSQVTSSSALIDYEPPEIFKQMGPRNI